MQQDVVVADLLGRCVHAPFTHPTGWRASPCSWLWPRPCSEMLWLVCWSAALTGAWSSAAPPWKTSSSAAGGAGTLAARMAPAGGHGWRGGHSCGKCGYSCAGWLQPRRMALNDCGAGSAGALAAGAASTMGHGRTANRDSRCWQHGRGMGQHSNPELENERWHWQPGRLVAAQANSMARV